MGGIREDSIKGCAERGFVLVDLMTTTLVIMLLAAFLFPVFARAREKARTTICQSNLLQIGMAMQVYAKDNYGQFPPTENDLTPLLPYLQEREVLHCPSQLSRRAQDRYRSYKYQAGHANDEHSSWILAYDRGGPIHNEGVNTLWLDGHVKWFRPSDNSFKLGLEGKQPPVPSYPPSLVPPSAGGAPGGHSGPPSSAPPPPLPPGAPPGMVPAPDHPPSEAPTPSKSGGKS